MDFIYATQFTTLTAIEIEIEHFFLLLYAFYYYEAALCATRGDISRKAKGRDNISFPFVFSLFFSFYFCLETWDKVFFCTFKQKKTAEVYRVFVFFDEVWLTDVALGFWERICTLTVQREG